jgi:hypothetical protein
MIGMTQKFSELERVKVAERFGSLEGYVVAAQFRDGVWVYKISLSEPDGQIYDNWIPEDGLERAPL